MHVVLNVLAATDNVHDPLTMYMWCWELHAPANGLTPPPADRQSLGSCKVRRNSRAGGRQRFHHAAMHRMRILTVLRSVVVRSVETGKRDARQCVFCGGAVDFLNGN